jgi:hypothetical protein
MEMKINGKWYRGWGEVMAAYPSAVMENGLITGMRWAGACGGWIGILDIPKAGDKVIGVGTISAVVITDISLIKK